MSKQPPAKPSAEFEQLSAALTQRTNAFREEIMKELAPVLNKEVQGMKWRMLEEKKAICEFVNDRLEPLGLAVQCPNTNLPAKLKATSGSWSGEGRFYLEVYSDDKQKKSKYYEVLPKELHLMNAYPPQEIGTHFQDKIGPKSSRTGRKLT